MSPAETSVPSIVTLRVPTDDSQRLRYHGRVSDSASPSGWTRRLSSAMSPLGMVVFLRVVVVGCRAQSASATWRMSECWRRTCSIERHGSRSPSYSLER